MANNINLNTFPPGKINDESLKILKAALDASVSGIIITDNRLPDNPIIYCNIAFEEITGYTQEEIIGHNCRFLQGDDRRQPERDILKDKISKGENANVEIRNYRKDGTLFWNELYVSPVLNDDNEVTHFVGVQHDVTRRKKAEEDLRHERDLIEQKVEDRTHALKMSREYLDSIIQTIRESLIVLDPEFKVLTVNEHFTKTFKVTRSETVGKKLFDLGNGQWNIEALKEMLHKILPTNNPVLDFEVEYTFPHIGRKLMLLNAHRVELEGEYKDRILLAIEDITDRRAIEQRKDDFLSVASHELKTPLTTVKGYVQIMTRLLPSNSGQKLKDVLAKTSVQIDRLNKLIEELLDVSRIQTGNLATHKDEFDFVKMVSETVEAIEAVSPSHNIIVEGLESFMYVGDESQLSQVVGNLLSNAIKYSPESEPVKLHISTIGNVLKFSVRDEGLGISKNDQRKIFERFYRVNTVQKKFPGMGIGLYICDQIIKLHGGTLWVDSEEGKGSSFSFTLPIMKGEAND